jgi:hypothetical protein
VAEKHVGNFCEYFDFARRVFSPPGDTNPREKDARAKLKDLLGD